jgi:hypothetical protein
MSSAFFDDAIKIINKNIKESYEGNIERLNEDLMYDMNDTLEFKTFRD